MGVRGVIPSFSIGTRCTLVGGPLAYTTKVALSLYTEPLRAGEWLHPAYPTLWLSESIVSAPRDSSVSAYLAPRHQPRGGVYEWPTADIPRARLCTREYTVVYTWVHHSVHACTHSPPRQEVYTGEPEASATETSTSSLDPAHPLSVASISSLSPHTLCPWPLGSLSPQRSSASVRTFARGRGMICRKLCTFADAHDTEVPSGTPHPSDQRGAPNTRPGSSSPPPKKTRGRAKPTPRSPSVSEGEPLRSRVSSAPHDTNPNRFVIHI